MNILFGILISFFVIISNVFPFIFLEQREFTFYEIFQVILILMCLIVDWKSKRLYLKYSNKFIFLSRFLFFTFLFYEEISFLTEGKSNIFNTFNSQSELSIHNLNFLGDTFLYIELPFLNYSASIEGYVFLVTFALFLIGYGSFFKFLRKFRFLFLERRYSFYTFIFIINYVLSSLIKKLVNPNMTFMHFEFVELFIYFLFLIDSIQKTKNLKSNTN